MTRRGWALFIAMGVIWGLPYLLIKVAVGELTPATLVLLRTGIGALLLVPLAATRGDLRGLRPYWKIIVAYSLIEVALPWLLLSDAERRLSSSLTGLLVAAVPLVAAVLAWRFGSHDRLDARRTLGLALGFVGVGALVGFDVQAGDLGAVAEVAVVTICYAVGPMLIAMRLSALPPIGVVAVSFALTAVICTPLGVAQLPTRLPSPAVLAAVAGLALVCTALAFVVFFTLIAEVGPTRATVITYINPAVALLLGVMLLREPLTIGAIVGFALILVGSVFTTRRTRVADVAVPDSRERRVSL
jgi:drug/metabolite transporter (DMT)-like permease